MNKKEENLSRLGMTEEDIQHEILLSKQHIQDNLDQIGQIFVDLGYAADKKEVKLTIGPELEFTLIAGADAFIKRNLQVITEIGQNRVMGGEAIHDINDKKQHYMPAAVRTRKLDKQFSAPIEKLTRNHGEKADKVRRTLVEPEPAFKLNTYQEFLPLKDANRIIGTTPDYLAASQIEFSMPPYSAFGAAEALNILMNKALHGAKGLKLKRADFTALPNSETSVNSIHLNAVITVNGVNAFSRKDWRHFLGSSEEVEPGTPSDLLLSIGKAHIDYLKHSLFMFARAESDYERFKKEEVSGPSFLGITSDKQHGNRSSAMFRGEGRHTERRNSATPEKPDKGPLRFELRVQCPGAAGHPNKEAYPEQRILPYQMIEAYTHMLLKGVELWKKREIGRRNDERVSDIFEQALHPDTLHLTDPQGTPLIHNKELAVKNFLGNAEVQSYWGDRIPTMLKLSNRLDQINEADKNPLTAEKGAHVERLIDAPAVEKNTGYYRH